MPRPRLPAGLNRLLKLADFLDRLPKERFDYEDWNAGGGLPTNPEKKCGTQACALGWACSVPEIAAEGLAFKEFGSGGEWGLALNGYTNMLEIDMAERVFDIPRRDAYSLFIPDNDYDGSDDFEPINDPGYVAMKIRNYVEAVRP